MPDPKLLEKQRDLAESLLISVMKMDEGSEESRNFSVENAVENVGIDPLSDVYLEQWLELRDMRLTALKHIGDYPHGFFVALLENVVNQWAKMKGYNLKKVRKDFMLMR